MLKKRILLFGTYPITNPQHGGQLRVAALVEAYKRAGHEVEYVGVFQKNFYPDYGPNDLPVSEPDNQTTIDVYTTDVRCGKQIHADPILSSRVARKINTFRPDIIQIEQMFPYFGLNALLKEINWQGKLVYSSHNIEHALKREILSSAGLSTIEQRDTIREIKEAELELVQKSDMVIACTESDASYYRSHNAPKVVIAPNGIAKRKVNRQSINKWRKKLAEMGVDKPVLYVGSAHPPNLKGFIDVIGFGLGFLPPRAKLILVGGIADLVAQSLALQESYIRAVFPLRGVLLGRIDEEDLGAILKLADTVILPITEGGGSNLKTAEAILSGAKVVATTHAFRSYESYKDLPNIHFADKPSSFRLAVTASVNAHKTPLSPSQARKASAVTWKRVLSTATKEVSAL